MLRKHMAACLMVTALAAAPALAQGDRPTAQGSGSTVSGSPSMNPGTTTGAGVTGGMSGTTAPPSNSTMGGTSAQAPAPAPAPGASAQSAPPAVPAPPAQGAAQAVAPGGGQTGNFIAQQQASQMLASKLIGTSVVSQDNESIGDVNDVLIDRGGQIQGVVIGVGGFLGIGEKSVAVKFDQLEFSAAGGRGQSADTSVTGGGARNLASSNTSGTAGSGTAGTSNPAGTGNAANNMSAPSTTGSTTGGATGNSTASASERIVLKMTKNDLQQAPSFQTADKAASNQSTSGNTATGGAPNPNPATGQKP